MVELVGHGTYGRVYKVRRKADGELLVLKAIPFDGLSEVEQQETLFEVKCRNRLKNSAMSSGM